MNLYIKFHQKIKDLERFKINNKKFMLPEEEEKERQASQMLIERGRTSLFNAPRKSFTTTNQLKQGTPIKSNGRISQKARAGSTIITRNKSRGRSPMRITRGVSRDKSASKKKLIINSQKILGLEVLDEAHVFNRTINKKIRQQYTKNPLEDFFMVNLSFKNAFNKYMMIGMGEEFCGSAFCLPVFVVRFNNRIVRNIFSGLEFWENEEEETPEIKVKGIKDDNNQNDQKRIKSGKNNESDFLGLGSERKNGIIIYFFNHNKSSKNFIISKYYKLFTCKNKKKYILKY